MLFEFLFSQLYRVFLILSNLFIYPTSAQLNCSKRMLKFTLIFTLKVLLHVSVYTNIIRELAFVLAKVITDLICGNKMPTRCYRGFYCRSYCLLNMFRASLCPSSGAQEHYTVVAACGILCCGFFK